MGREKKKREDFLLERDKDLKMKKRNATIADENERKKEIEKTEK